tara:strand:+ start:3731 stop:4804 length:1074 start_codon:yes stop_codon:yes gene_type:complete
MKLKLNMELPSEIELPDELLGANAELSKRLETLETDLESLQSQPPTPDREKLKQDLSNSVDTVAVDPDDVEQLKRDVRDLRNRANLFASEIDSLRNEKMTEKLDGVVSILDFCTTREEQIQVIKGERSIDNYLASAIVKLEEVYGLGRGVISLPVGKLRAAMSIEVPPGVSLVGQGKFQTSLTVDISTSSLSYGIRVVGRVSSVKLQGFSLNVAASRGDINGILLGGELIACELSDLIISSDSTLAKSVGVTLPDGGSALLEINNCAIMGWKVGLRTAALMTKTSCRIGNCNTGIMALKGLLDDASEISECNLDHYIGRESLGYETREGSNTFDARDVAGGKATFSVGTFQTGDTLL